MSGANTAIYQSGRDFVWTDEVCELFFEKLANSGSVLSACRKVGAPRSTVYHRKAHDDAFAARWEAALHVACARFEHAAIKRAVVGWEEPVFGSLPGEHSGSGVIGYKRKYSDAMLGRVLEAHHPDYKREAKGPTSVTINVVNILQDANDRARSKLLECTEGRIASPAAAEVGS